MATTFPDTKTTVKKVKLTDAEAKRLQQLSRVEHLPEDVLLRRWVLEGLDRMRLERDRALRDMPSRVSASKTPFTTAPCLPFGR